ncbi:hypothetical protein WR25_20941 [Diploscapter pachys]|uniref:Alpha-ketoglutarate-dependent dioxygenase AlkB-like domain-containing protein n=1 Tax=Diploscapter pachys TaxID=2018661 RepID=A0A2A2KAD9_9BILA|nr:hypothetical protein WR25_20941 [Diploscapter pachys]
MEGSIAVVPDFITEEEETTIFNELEPHMKRLRYEKSHWDDAINNYREREQRTKWREENARIVQRIRDFAFPANAQHLTQVHILDLHEEGVIKPHIDSIRYCGDVIAGVSLLSSSVMRLRHKDSMDELIVDLYLKRRSLYKLSGIARYDFKHEILDKNESMFDGIEVPRKRRISIICRDVPKTENVMKEKIEMKPLEELEPN